MWEKWNLPPSPCPWGRHLRAHSASPALGVKVSEWYWGGFPLSYTEPRYPQGESSGHRSLPLAQGQLLAWWMWFVCSRKWNLNGRMGARNRSQTHSQARHAPGAGLQWPRLPSVVTCFSQQHYFTGNKHLKIASDMTNRRQNVAFSCHLAAFTLVVGRWFKEVESKYLDSENTLTAPFLYVYI